MARQKRYFKKGVMSKALDASMQHDQNQEELESWWTTTFGSAKLLIYIDLSKLASGNVQTISYPKPPTIIKMPWTQFEKWPETECNIHQINYYFIYKRNMYQITPK